MFFVCIFLFAILSVGKMYRFSLFAHWLCIVYKYKKLWSAIHSMCIKSPCNTFQGILSHMKKPDSREVATRARMEEFFTVAFYIISLKKRSDLKCPESSWALRVFEILCDRIEFFQPSTRNMPQMFLLCMEIFKMHGKPSQPFLLTFFLG